MMRGGRRELIRRRSNANCRHRRGRFRARRMGAPDGYALAEGASAADLVVPRVGEHCEVARALDGAGERPLALGAHARLASGLDLGLIGEEAAEEVDVLVVDLLALGARANPPPSREVPSPRPTRRAARSSSLIGWARARAGWTRGPVLRRAWA